MFVCVHLWMYKSAGGNDTQGLKRWTQEPGGNERRDVTKGKGCMGAMSVKHGKGRYRGEMAGIEVSSLCISTRFGVTMTEKENV